MASIPLEVFVGQDFYVPAYRISVADQELGAEELHDVMSVTYTDSLTAIDSFDMTVNNWDPDARRTSGGKQIFKYSDGNAFAPWKKVELSMGYYRRGLDERRPMLTGEITTLSPNFPDAGGPTLGVRGLNLLHRFRLKQETKAFFDQSDTDIAVAIVKKIDEALRKQFPKLSIAIDPADIKRNAGEPKHGFLLMNNQYPIVFLMERARRIGYELVIRAMPGQAAPGSKGDVILGFGPSSSVERPTYVLEWGKSLISLQPTLRVAGQVSKVTVRGWSPSGKEPIKAEATRAKLGDSKVVHPVDLDLAEPALAEEVTVDRPVANKQEAERYAKDILRQKASELVTAKGRTIGLPDLRAGVKVQIKGLGPRFSGRDDKPFVYVITDTTHTFGDGGYTTEFTARMEAGDGPA